MNLFSQNHDKSVILTLILINFILNNVVCSYEYVRFVENGKRFMPLLRTGDVLEKSADIEESEEEIKQLLEKKYKFKNDKKSRRFRVTTEEAREESDFPESKVAIAFRSYAARRIVGGMETSVSMYPYNVAISRNGRHWCGGSIIDEQWVISAGHCFEAAHDGTASKLNPFIIRAGSSFHNRGGYQARVNKVFFPSGYAPGSADYDYSLIRLDRPMPIGRNIAVLNLPSKDYSVKIDDLLIITGWGSTHESGSGHIPERLRFVPVPVMKQSQCQESYRFYITRRMLCAGYATGGKDACNHDSGGPAVRDGVLLGIVSFGGKQCGDPNSPGVYSRVSEITDWVEQTVSNNEAYTVKELIPKIEKARLRERELQRFKARVEEKQNKIKNWLRETLKSPKFFKLAKKKLKEVELNTRRILRPELFNSSNMDEKAMDERNVMNLIQENIIEGDEENNESEKLLRTLALHELIADNNKENKKSALRSDPYQDFRDFEEDDSSERYILHLLKLRPISDSDESIEALVAYIT